MAFQHDLSEGNGGGEVGPPETGGERRDTTWKPSANSLTSLFLLKMWEGRRGKLTFIFMNLALETELSDFC